MNVIYIVDIIYLYVCSYYSNIGVTFRQLHGESLAQWVNLNFKEWIRVYV